MSSGSTTTAGAAWTRRGSDLVLPFVMIASVLVILVPLPPALLDVLLAGNIAIAVLVLLTTIYVRTPLEFSVFPSLLLATTLVRLVLNVASTRLILTRAGTDGVEAAGHVLNSFANFVAGDQIVVGAVIFAIIVVIQFVVITKGATRIGEVAARFALDGMPGKQMAIDAELNGGTIDQQEAQCRRAEVSQQADFYGAMDGASKFVRGDAIAGLVITAINIVGGFIIGVVEFNMSVGEAASVFTRLTIGDGLVAQVPAFLISLAAALLVTRSTSRADMPREFVTQLFARPQALAITGGFLAVLVFTSLPKIPLLALGAACFGLSRTLTRREAARETDARAEAERKQSKNEERVEDFLAVDPLEIELGVGLIRLADSKRGGDLLERIHRVRHGIASEIGIIMPKVRLRDNMRLEPNQYRIKIAGIPVAQNVIYPGKLLATTSRKNTDPLVGASAKQPAWRTNAKWIEPSLREQAELQGCMVEEPGAVLAIHLTEICRRHADELLTRDAAKHLFQELKQTSPAAVEELIPELMSLAEVQNILHRLLREQIPLKQLGLILESLGDFAPKSKNPVLLTEYVRHRLARQITARYCDANHQLHAVTLSPSLEDQIQSGFDLRENGIVMCLSLQERESICRHIREGVEKLLARNLAPIVLVSPQIRPAIREMTASELPDLIVLSTNELTREAKVKSLGLAPGNGTASQPKKSNTMDFAYTAGAR